MVKNIDEDHIKAVCIFHTDSTGHEILGADNRTVANVSDNFLFTCSFPECIICMSECSLVHSDWCFVQSGFLPLMNSFLALPCLHTVHV